MNATTKEGRKAMNELEKARKETAERLNKYGYNGKETSGRIERITAYYNGQPSRVEVATKDGKKVEIYL